MVRDLQIVEIKGKEFRFGETYLQLESYYSVFVMPLDEYSSGVAELSTFGERLPDDEHLWFYFNRLFVHPNLRRQGIADFLVDKVVDFAQREQISILGEVNPYGDLDLEALSAFYVKHGFTRHDETVIFVPQDKFTL